MNAQFSHWFLLFIGLAGSMAAFTSIFRVMSPPVEDETGLAGISPRKGELSVFDRLNPNGGLIDRLDFFLARVCKFDAKIEEMYMLWGRPQKYDPIRILHWKELCAVLIPAVAVYVSEVPVLALLAPVAFFLPDFYIKGQIQERQTRIIRNFPSMVDLAALTIESGQDYMAAFDKICKAQQKKTDLEYEFEQTLNEVQLGYAPKDALRRMAMRIGVQDIRSFVGLIIQSQELGTSLVELLRNFSSDMRHRRLSKAEKAAAEASTKMLFPIFFFIFPVVFILMLSPMLVSVFEHGLGF